MQFFEGNSTVWGILVSIISGALGGGIWNTVVQTYIESRKRAREESSEARAIVNRIYPLLLEIEDTYRIDLSDSVLLRDLEEEIGVGEIATIKVRLLDKRLSDLLGQSNLIVLKRDLSARLIALEPEMKILAKDIANIQQSGYFTALDEPDIAWAAKSAYDRRLADFVKDLYGLRIDIAKNYFGKAAIKRRDKDKGSKINDLWRRAYEKESLLRRLIVKYVAVKKRIYYWRVVRRHKR